MFKPIWRVMVTPVNGSPRDVSYAVQKIDVQDATSDRSSTFSLDLWDHEGKGYLNSINVGSVVDIWTDTFQSASDDSESEVITIGAGQTSSPVSLPVKSWGILSPDPTNVLVSTSMDGTLWTPFLACNPDGTIKNPPYRNIKIKTTSAFSGSNVTINYKSMPKRLTGKVVTAERYQNGPNVIGLKLTGYDYTSTTLNILVNQAYKNQTPDAIIKNILQTYFPDITYNNVQTGAAEIPYIKFPHKKAFDCFNDLAQISGWDWYVDENKDFHWFPASQTTNPIVLTSHGIEANVERGSATFKWDSSQMTNKFTFYGGNYLSNNRTEYRPGDGHTKTFFFTYAFAALPSSVTVDGVVKTIGTDGVDTGKDFYAKVGERYLRQDDAGTTLISTDVLELTYQYNIPVIEQNQNDDSISKYGLYEQAVVDSTVKDQQTARLIIQAKLQEYSFPIIYGTLNTWEPNFRAGEMVVANLPDEGINNLNIKITQVHHQITPKEYKISISVRGQGN